MQLEFISHSHSISSIYYGIATDIWVMVEVNIVKYSISYMDCYGIIYYNNYNI